MPVVLNVTTAGRDHFKAVSTHVHSLLTQRYLIAGFVAPPVMLVDGSIVDAASLPRNSRQGSPVSVSSEELMTAVRSAPGSSTGQPSIVSPEALLRSEGLTMQSEGQASLADHSLRSSTAVSGQHTELQEEVEDQPIYYHPLLNPQGVAISHSPERYPGRRFS